MGKLAALSSGLLARKGQARPAMRPQGFAGFTTGDDLGWNDMGDGAAAPDAPAPVLPPVLIERTALAGQVASSGQVDATTVAVPEAPVRRSVSVATATRIRRETALATKKGGRAAFTLRLDADRHLRLRLAGAIANRSAQILMTEALDAFLGTMPEVEALVAALPPAKRR